VIIDFKYQCVDKRRGGHGHGSGSLLFLHQAVTWSLTSPLYNDTFHLTGVYIFPAENQLQEWTLSQYTLTPPPTNPKSVPEILMPTLPKNWKITSHPKNYAPSSAAQEMSTRLIPLLPPLTSATVRWYSSLRTPEERLPSGAPKEEFGRMIFQKNLPWGTVLKFRGSCS